MDASRKHTHSVTHTYKLLSILWCLAAGVFPAGRQIQNCTHTCICACTYMFVYMYTHTHMFIYLYTLIYEHIHIYMYKSILPKKPHIFVTFSLH